MSTSLKRYLPNKMMLSGDVITSDGKIDPVLWARNSPHVRETKTILDSGFHAMDSGFQSWIPDLFQWNLDPDSKAQDSGFHMKKFPGFRNPDSLIWGPTNIHFLSAHFCKSILACYAYYYSFLHYSSYPDRASYLIYCHFLNQLK